MSVTTWVKKNSRALGKLALYGTGGVLIGAPVIRFGSNLWNGMGIKQAADMATYDSYGVSTESGGVNQAKLRNGAITTGLGAAFIWLGRKV